MRRLLPRAEQVPGPYDELFPREPWVGAGMVVSLDGAVSIGGVSTDLGGPGDRSGFRGLRRLADVVMVGAGTVRAEDYGPASPRDAAVRVGRGQAPAPAIAVVTSSARLDPSSRLFSDPARPPVVVTTSAADLEHRRALEAVADVVVVGDGDRVDPAAALAALRERGHGRVLVEGGPALFSACVQSGVIDELLVTVAPTLVGQAGPRLLSEVLDRPIDLVLLAATVHGSELLLRYRVLGPR